MHISIIIFLSLNKRFCIFKASKHTFKTDPEQVQLTLPSLEMYHLTSSLVSL